MEDADSQITLLNFQLAKLRDRLVLTLDQLNYIESYHKTFEKISRKEVDKVIKQVGVKNENLHEICERALKKVQIRYMKNELETLEEIEKNPMFLNEPKILLPDEYPNPQ